MYLEFMDNCPDNEDLCIAYTASSNTIQTYPNTILVLSAMSISQ